MATAMHRHHLPLFDVIPITFGISAYGGDSNTLVFDMRGGKVLTKKACMISDISVLENLTSKCKFDLKRYGIHEPFSTTFQTQYRDSNILVLLDNEEQKDRLVFIKVNTCKNGQYEKLRGELLVYTNPTSESSVSILTNNLMEIDYMRNTNVSLSHKGKRLPNDKMLRQFVEYHTTIDCCIHEPTNVKIKHSPKDSSIENIYTVQCLSFDNVRDIMDKLITNFRDQFESMLTENDNIWLLQNGSIMSEDDVFDERIHSELEVLLCPKHFIPIQIRYENPEIARCSHSSARTMKEDDMLLFVSPYWSTMSLRQEISHKICRQANSLSLSVNKKRLHESACVSSTPQFVSNCTVKVTLMERHNIQVTSRKYGEHTLGLFELDTIFDLKKELAGKLSVEPLFIRMFCMNVELQNNERALKNREYQYKFSVDKHAVYFTLRHPRQSRKIVTVYNSNTCSVQTVKREIAGMLAVSAHELNLVYKGNLMQDTTMIGQYGLKNGEDVVVIRGQESVTGSDDVKIVFLVSGTGVAKMRLMKEENGIIFYAPDTITLEDFKSKTRNKAKIIPKHRNAIGYVELEDFLSSRTAGNQQIKSGYKRRMEMHHMHNMSKQRRSVSGTDSSTSAKGDTQHATSLAGTEQRNCKETHSTHKSLEEKTTSEPQNRSFHRKCISPSKKTSQFPEHLHSNQHPVDNNLPSTSKFKTVQFQKCSETELMDSDREEENHVSVKKKLQYRKALVEHGDQKRILEVAKYEEIVSNEEADEAFHSRKPMLSQSSFDESGHASGYSTTGDSELSFVDPRPAVSNRILQFVGRELCGEWRAFALEHLDLPYSSIQKYEETYPKDITMQAFGALKQWQDKLGKNATLTVLKENLIRYEKKSIADALDDVASKNYQSA